MTKYTVNQAFKIASEEYQVVTNIKVFYRWLSSGELTSIKRGKERIIDHDDLMKMINAKLSPFTKQLIKENQRLKELLSTQVERKEN